MLLTLSAIIPAGQSESNWFSVGAGRVLRIEMPDAWTPANLTFLIAKQGTQDFREAYSVVLTTLGDPLLVPVRPGAVAVVGENTFCHEANVKLQSGAVDAPVPQEFDRAFTIVVLRDQDAAGEPPSPLSAAMTNGETVVAIAFNAALDDTSVPVANAFEVIVKGVAKPVTAVVVADTQCRLTMDARYASGPITVSYNKPASGAQLMGVDGGAVASFFTLPVTLP